MANRRGMILPVIASVGIGAAAYYSMRKGKGLGNVAEQMLPFAGGMGNQGQQQNQQSNN